MNMLKKYTLSFLLIVGILGIGNVCNAMCETETPWCKDAQRCGSRLEWCIKNGPQELAMYLANQPPGQRDKSLNKTGIEAYEQVMNTFSNPTREFACQIGCKTLQSGKLCTGICQ